MNRSARPKVGIVGGGPGGLMTAYFLQQRANRSLDVTILERSERLGGKILTPGFASVRARYEAGAAEFYDYSVVDEDPLKELIAELGLPISPMGGHSVYLHGQYVANLDDLERVQGADARRSLVKFYESARDEISPVEYFLHGGDESTAVGRPGEHFDRQLAEQLTEAARRYVETMIHSDLATESRITSRSYGLQNYLMNDPAYMQLYGIEGGNEQLPAALAARLDAKVQLGRCVCSVERGENGRLFVESRDDAQTLHRDEFDYVVVALPLDAFRHVEFRGERLATALQTHFEHYHHPAHYLRVTIAFERPFWLGTLVESYCQLEAFGGCCLYDESSRWPDSRYGILGWLLGGDAAVKYAQLDDQTLVRMALATLPESLSAGRDLFVEGRVHRWLEAVNAMPGGWTARPLDLRHQPEPQEHPRLFVVGDYLFDSTLNGVLDSADYVSEWIASQINA
ncbi:MAG: FAD-dependent oxidoreductase [Pirellulales bacterium]